MSEKDTHMEKIEKFFVSKSLMDTNDAKVYMELWTNGQQTTRQLERNLILPSSTLQNAKKRLLSKGFIEETPGEGNKRSTPQIFRATSPTDIIDTYLSDAKEIQSLIDELGADLEVERPKKEQRRQLSNNWLFIRHEEHVSLKTISKKLENAKKSIMIYGTDCDFIGRVFDILVKKQRNGIRVEIIGTFEGERGERSKKLLEKHKINHSITKLKFMPFCIIDENDLMVGIEPIRGKHSCMFIDNEYAIERYCSLFKGLKEGV